MVEGKAVSGSRSVFGSSRALFLLSIVLVVAFIYSATLVVKTAAMVLVLMFSLRLWTALGFWRLELETSCEGERFYPGESFSLQYKIANRKILPLWIRLKFQMPESLEVKNSSVQAQGAIAHDSHAEAETSLRPFEHRSGFWNFKTTRRGVHLLGPAVLTVGDILGLYSRVKELPSKHTIIVYPRIVPICIPELPFMEYFGIHPAKGIIEDPAWYEGTREYSGNKPARHIHWKASARLNELQEKIFQPTTHRKIYIILMGDNFAQAPKGADFEAAVELAASLASVYAETGASVAVATDRKVANYPAGLDLGRGPEQLGRILELLARCEPGKGGQEFLALVRGSSIEGCGFIVISRLANQGAAMHSGMLPKRKDRLLFIYAEQPSPGLDLLYPYLTFEDLFVKGPA